MISEKKKWQIEIEWTKVAGNNTILPALPFSFKLTLCLYFKPLIAEFDLMVFIKVVVAIFS